MKKSARGEGFMTMLLIFTALIHTLFASTSLYARKDNSYIGTMDRIGLQYIDEADASADAVEKYTYADSDAARTNRHGAGNLLHCCSCE